jgi:hypothetical protein
MSMTSNNNTKGIISFSDFYNSIQFAKEEQFKSEVGKKMAKEDTFSDMRTYLIGHYKEVEVVHSFMDENGSVFDCIPIEKQPALKNLRQSVAKAPDLPELQSKSDSKEDRYIPNIGSTTSSNLKDKFGNDMVCPPGSIPVRRITLEELGRFESLENFFQKGPGGSGKPPAVMSSIEAEVAATHKYAHAYQNVNNLGGHSFLNTWAPLINTSRQQIFSLSQHWYVGGSGSTLQTAEVGWQVYPQKYSNSYPTLFIYWTADGYNRTGCYNLDCSAFIQTNRSVTIGGTIGNISIKNGSQYDKEVAFYLSQGNWWLYIGGTSSSNAIGYYPTSIYRNGALASKASSIDYGGETVGTTSWPPMGSGEFANTGWQKAAYQRNISYYPTTGGAVDANLTVSNPSPGCYTAIVTKYNPPWNETLWFGGPGGTNC